MALTGGAMATAQETWDFDVDPTAAKYTAGGALFDANKRTDFLANRWAPSVDAKLAAMEAQLSEILVLLNTGGVPAADLEQLRADIDSDTRDALADFGTGGAAAMAGD